MTKQQYRDCLAFQIKELALTLQKTVSMDNYTLTAHFIDKIRDTLDELERENEK